MRQTSWWLAAIAWAILIFYLTSIPNLKIVEDTLLSFLFTSLAHFFFFGVQALLIHFALAATPIWPVLLTSLYGVFDELHQLTVPGRSATFLDWTLDTLGAAIFLYLLLKFRQKGIIKP